jgi:hypothetical protein
MAYVITFETEFTDVQENFTTTDWLANVSYADLNGFFPEISESEWPVIQTRIINMFTPMAKIGVTPGLLDYTINTTPSKQTIIATFDSKKSYEDYAIDRMEMADYGLVLHLPKTTNKFIVKDFITLDGRSIIDSRPGYSIPNPLVGQWLIRKYQLYRGVAITIIHTET